MFRTAWRLRRTKGPYVSGVIRSNCFSHHKEWYDFKNIISSQYIKKDFHDFIEVPILDKYSTSQSPLSRKDHIKYVEFLQKIGFPMTIVEDELFPWDKLRIAKSDDSASGIIVRIKLSNYSHDSAYFLAALTALRYLWEDSLYKIVKYSLMLDTKKGWGNVPRIHKFILAHYMRSHMLWNNHDIGVLHKTHHLPSTKFFKDRRLRKPYTRVGYSTKSCMYGEERMKEISIPPDLLAEFRIGCEDEETVKKLYNIIK